MHPERVLTMAVSPNISREWPLSMLPTGSATGAKIFIYGRCKVKVMKLPGFAVITALALGGHALASDGDIG